MLSLPSCSQTLSVFPSINVNDQVLQRYEMTTANVNLLTLRHVATYPENGFNALASIHQTTRRHISGILDHEH
jgi:hypothetical protein